MLVSLQTYLIYSPELVLELVNECIQEEDLKLVTLQGTSQGVPLLFVPPEISPLALSFSGESKEKNIGLDLKIFIIPKITISKLFSKKISFLKLSTTLFISIPKEKASTMS